jgi:flagellar biosynthesis protein FlhG
MHLIEERPAPRHRPDLIIVGGGKGGVGKTCFAVNMAVEIARRGYKVVLLDADLSCSNVEHVLGIRAQTRLDDYFRAPAEAGLEAVLAETPYPNLRLISGTSGLLDVANPRYQQKAALIKDLRTLDTDTVIVDLDAGAHLNTVDLFRLSDTQGIVIITPERTSIDNAFKFLRAALFRRIEQYFQSPELTALLQRSASLDQFLACVLRATYLDEVARRRISDESLLITKSFRPKIVVNKVENQYEAQVAANILSKFVRQHLGIEMDFIGQLFFDPCVSDSVNSGIPFVANRPQLKVSGCIVDMANRLGYF